MLLFCLLLTSFGINPSEALEITLPPETATLTKSTLTGYLLVQKNCLICHSAQYIQLQPQTSQRLYWEATVRKMKAVFGARFSDEEIFPMVEYLVKTYGTN